MNCLPLIVVLFSTLLTFEIMAQFPNSNPYQWKPLPSGINRQTGAYGGGNGHSGSVNIAGQQRINPKWEVGGKVGVDYGRGGYFNKKIDAGVGYNVGKNTQIRGSVGADFNRFGSDKRVGIGINHRFGRK